jgi:hypothetical protein
VFYSIINFQVWITVITELFELDDEFRPFQRRWNRIFERLRAEKDVRDRLAYHYIMGENVSNNRYAMPIKAAARMDLRAKSIKSPPLTLDQVLAFRDRIDAIADDIQSLSDEMLKHMKTPRVASASPEKPSEHGSDQGT